MRKIISKNIFLTAFLLLLGFFLRAQDFPPRSSTLVTDLAGILSNEEKASLESKLVSFNDSSSTQIAVVMMHSTGEYDISDYAVRLFNAWKIGQQSKNNGVLILVAVDDHKVFINTGYGVEGALPDALCKQIVDRDIVPAFKRGDYYTGIDDATSSIISLVKGEFTAEQYLKTKKSKPVFFPMLMFIFIVIIVIFSQFGRVNRYSKRNNLGFWAAWALLNAASGRSRGSWGGFSGGSGGFGGGGGGFGGFGGGSSGGGGAGGSW